MDTWTLFFGRMHRGWLVFAVLQVLVCVAFSGELIDSPLREREPLTAEEMEEMVFGITFDELDLESECHIEIDMQWMATLGASTLPNAPMVGDFRNDGSKEIVVAVGNEYIEVLEGETGNKEPGWPFYIPDRSFPSSPIDHDLSGGSVRDIVVATDRGEILFLSEAGFPYHGATLKVPNMMVDREWYKEYLAENQTLFEPLYTKIPSSAARRKECDEMSKRYLSFYDETRAKAQGRLPTEREFQSKFRQSFDNHVQEQKVKVQQHMDNMKKMFDRRRVLQVDDDLEDDQGARFDEKHEKLAGAMHTFEGVEGWLTNDGVESLELFLPTEMSSSFVSSLRTSADVLYSPQYENYLEVAKPPKKKKDQVELVPRIVGSPIVVDLEGDGHNEIVVAVNYGPDMKNADYTTNPGLYSATAVVAFDLMLHQVKWISRLELSVQTRHYHASFYSAPTIIDLDGDGELNIVIGSAMGHIHVLDNYGTPVSGFPIAMGSIHAPVVVEDIDQDGRLDIIGIDSISNLAVFSWKGKRKWDIQLTPGCVTAPAIADINGDSVLDIVVSCNSGVVHAVDAMGKEVQPFPILQEPGMKGSPTLMKMRDNEHYHVLSMAASGHLYITDAVDACTEVVDIGLGAGLMAPMIIADDVTGNGMMDLVVTTGFRFLYCLSTDTEYHPLNVWNSASHKRNVYTSSYHQGVYFLEEFREHRDISGTEFLIQIEIVDNRVNREGAYYDVQLKLRRDLDPLFAARFLSPGYKSITVQCPQDRMAGTLRIEMTNEHQQFFSDSISLTFNMKFYRSIKWMVLIPFTVCAVFVLYLKREFVEMLV